MYFSVQVRHLKTCQSYIFSVEIDQLLMLLAAAVSEEAETAEKTET